MEENIKLIKKENYLVIQGWMITELYLKGNELMVYAIIYGFSQTDSQCYSGSLKYLAEWCSCTKQGIINNLTTLIQKGLIQKKEKYINDVKFCEYYSTELNEVFNKVEQGGQQSCIGGSQQSLPNNKDNDKIDNNKEDNKDYGNNQFFPPQKRFVKPTIAEIAAYCNERNNGIEPEAFYDYYESKGWKVGRNSMKNWRAAIRNWERQKKEKNSAQKERKVELNDELKELKEIFCNFYREKVGMIYNWSDRESASLIELANKIGSEIKNDTTLKMNFEAMLRRLPDWYKQNGLDINIINKNFNNIKNQIKNGEGTDYDYLMRKYSASL